MFGFLKRLFVQVTQPVQSSAGGEPHMKYTPRIAWAETVAQYEIAGHRAALFDNIVSAGMVQYQYVLVVYERDGGPGLFVTSEVNQDRETFGGGSHFLGVFSADGHDNLGDSDEWANRERFVERALTIAREYLSAA